MPADIQSGSDKHDAQRGNERFDNVGTQLDSYRTASLSGSGNAGQFGTKEGLTHQEGQVEKTRDVLAILRGNEPGSEKFKEGVAQFDDLAKGHAKAMADFQKYMVDLQTRLGSNSDKLNYDEKQILADVQLFDGGSKKSDGKTIST